MPARWSLLPCPLADKTSWVGLRFCNTSSRSQVNAYRTWESLLATCCKGLPFSTTYVGRRHRTTILASSARLCVKGSIRPSPSLARGCVNQCHDTLAATIGLFLPDYINPLMETLIMCRPAGSIIQHEIECHMVASITWFTIRTLPKKESLDVRVHRFNFLLILACT